MRNKNLDIIKIIAAIFIVLIHVRFPSPVGEIVANFAGFAVPVFFMVSGYFSYNAIVRKDYAKLFARIKKLIIIYIPSTLFHFAVGYFIKTPSQRREFITDGLSLKGFLKLILFNKPLFNTTLWFILALIYCYFIVMLFVKIDKMKFLSFCSIILIAINIVVTDLVLGVFCNKISQYFPVSQLYMRNFLFSGITMFMVGYLIKKYSDKINTISNKALFLSLAAGVIIFAAEYMIFEHKAAISGKTIAIVLFILATNNKNNTVYSAKDKIMSEMPLVIYIVHLPLSAIICYFINEFSFTENIVFSYIYPIIIVLLSLAISYIVSIFIVKSQSSKMKATE